MLEELCNDPRKDLGTWLDADDDALTTACNYYLPHDIGNLIDSTCKLKIMHLNIHSLPNKIGELKHLLHELEKSKVEIDIIMLCETYINDVNKYRCVIPNYTIEELHRTETTGGGVCLFINDRIKYKLRDDLSIFNEGLFESCFIEVYTGKKNIIVGEVYRIPNTPEKEFIDKYESIIGKVYSEKKEILIGTDQNLDLLKIEQHANTANFLNLNLASGILPMITKPSRVTHTSATLIDNIYTNSELATVGRSAILVSDISDHFPCLVLFDRVFKKDMQPLKFMHRKITDVGTDRIKENIINVDWNVMDNMNIDDAYEYFVTELTSIIDTYAPLREVTIPAKKVLREAWMTTALLKSSQECSKKYNSVVGLNKNSEEYVDYLTYRNTYNKLKRIAKQTFYDNKIRENMNNNYQLWKILNEVIGKKHDKSTISSEFLIDGKLNIDPSDISNGFCSYFSTVGQNLASKIPRIDKQYSAYLTHPSDNTFFILPTDHEEIFKIITSLKPKNSTGHDGFSNNLLKQFGKEISVPLAIIINESFKKGKVPDPMKLAKVIPVYKANDKTLMSNYRPISLLPTLAKILEKIMYKRLYDFLKRNNVLFKSQYGFRDGHSTVHAITELCSDIYKGFEERKLTLGIFLDLSKAFDTVNHSILLKKLEYYGIRGISLDWFKSYVTNRMQFVQYKNAKSEILEIKCGVPQGSVLGPLLFIIYINDLHKCLEKAKALLFADDTTLYMTCENKIRLFSDMRCELNKLIVWFQVNKLSLNLSKTHYVLFRPKNLMLDSDIDEHCELKFGNETIEYKEYVKFLGMFLDKFLDWSKHYTHLRTKLAKSIYIMNAAKHQLPTDCLKKLYYSMYYSHLTYGIALWGHSMATTNVNKITLSQKKIIRVVSKANYNAHTEPLFKSANILKLNDIITIETNKLMYQIAKQEAPIPLVEFFLPVNITHNYMTRHRYDPVIIPRQYSIIDRSFLCRGPASWSALSYEVKNAISLKSFNNQLKKTIFKNY